MPFPQAGKGIVFIRTIRGAAAAPENKNRLKSVINQKKIINSFDITN